MKISNWESIPYSVGLQCPNGDDGSFMEGKSKAFLNSLEEDIVYQEQGLEAWSELTLKRFKHEI